MSKDVALRPQFTPLVPRTMDEAFRMAEVMARGKLVPVHLQGSVADCLLCVEYASRWSMSPFAVAQCTSSIHGRLMFEGKLVAAAVESMGAIDGYFDYTFTGDGDERTVTVRATRHGEKDAREVSVVLKNARTDNKHWKTQSDQMLCYHGARVWARRWTPSAILGAYTVDEFERGDVPAEHFTGTTVDGHAEASPSPAAAGDARDALNASIPLREEPPPPAEPEKRRGYADWFPGFFTRIGQAQTAASVEAIIAEDKAVTAVRLRGSDQQKRDVEAAIEAARVRVRRVAEPSAPPDGEMET